MSSNHYTVFFQAPSESLSSVNIPTGIIYLPVLLVFMAIIFFSINNKPLVVHFIKTQQKLALGVLLGFFFLFILSCSFRSDMEEKKYISNEIKANNVEHTEGVVRFISNNEFFIGKTKIFEVESTKEKITRRCYKLKVMRNLHLNIADGHYVKAEHVGNCIIKLSVRNW